MDITPALLIDVVLLAVLVVTVLGYVKKGFVSGLINLVGTLISLALAWIVSGRVSPTVFENFFKSGLTERMTDALRQHGAGGLNEILEGLSGILPQRLLDDVAAGADSLFASGAPNAAQRVVEEIITPLVVPLITVVLFFATFVICRVIVALLVAALTNLNKLPIVGGVNKLLGAVVGLVAGLLHVLLALCLLWAIIVITNGTLPGLNDAALSGSILYQLFSAYNPFLS